MIESKISLIANYFWKKSIDNINTILSTDLVGSFNMNDYYYLTVISQLVNPNLGDIAQELKLTKPAISAMVQRLIKNDLIIKKQSLEDKRIFTIELTEKGLRIIHGDELLYRNLANEIENLLDEKQLFDIDCLLSMLVDQIQNKQRNNK